MTNKEILKKAIEKAIKNGYEVPKDLRFYPVLPKNPITLWSGDPITYKELKETGYEDFTEQITFWGDDSVESIIFSHSFAKAFWGKKCNCSHCQVYKKTKQLITAIPFPKNHNLGWQFYFQQMVLEKNPLKYLEKFLK